MNRPSGKKIIWPKPVNTPIMPVALPSRRTGESSAMSADSDTVRAPKPTPRMAEKSKTIQASVPSRWPKAGTPKVKADSAITRR